jgi:DNA polymerase kappa
MADLPVRKIPGVGKINEMILAGLNIFTCWDLINRSTAIYINFTERAFDFLVKSALGIGKNTHDKADQLKKSLSVCLSFKPITDSSDIQHKLDHLVTDFVQRC